MTAFSTNEAARLDALRRYAILDSEPEASFDRLCRMTARALHAPMVAISLVDADRVWFKSRIGLTATEVPRSLALCARTISSNRIYELQDATLDPALCGNPLFDGPLHLRFYAGAPLVTPDNFCIGTLCVIDSEPREALTPDQRAALTDLAATVMTEMERRRHEMLQERASRRLALINDILGHVGSAGGFVAAIEAAMTLLCRHTGAAFGHLWDQASRPSVRSVAVADLHDILGGDRAGFEAGFAAAAAQSDLSALLSGDGPLISPDLTPELIDAIPLCRFAHGRGIRAMVAVPLQVVAERYVLVLKFTEHRDDLSEIAALAVEVGAAIRPALQRKQAEDRLALLNDILACVSGASGFVAAIEAAIMRLCRHTGAAFGHLWDQTRGETVRLAGFAADQPLQPAMRNEVFASFDEIARQSALGTLLAGERPYLAPNVSEASVADVPLLAMSYEHGMRSFLVLPLPVGADRFSLVLKFNQPRDDLAVVADLLAETSSAIRPALLRKLAEDRLALMNEVLACTSGADGFVAAIEAAMSLMVRQLGGMFGMMWSASDDDQMVRLAGLSLGEGMSEGYRAGASAAFPFPAGKSLLAGLLRSGGRMALPSISDEMSAKFPLLATGRENGLRSLVAQAVFVGSARYLLVFGFGTERRDLESAADLLLDVGNAIRPALQRKQAQDRLTLLQAAVDATEDSVTITDASGEKSGDCKIIYSNPSFTRLTGYSAAEARGQPIGMLRGHGTDPSAVAELDAAAVEARAAWLELINYTKGGKPFWAELSTTPVPDESGRTAYWVGVMRDSSERRASQEALQRMAATLQDRTRELTEVARLARIGSWRWLVADGSLEWSDETYEIFGLTREGFTPTADAFFGLLHPDDRGAARAAGGHSIKTGADLQVEARAILPNGKLRAMVWNARGVHGPDGEVVALHGYCQDVTERRETEAALRHGEKLRALGKLTGGIAHDFNNKLTVILANLDIALDGGFELSGAAPALEAARTAALGATELTRRLLSFGRSEPLRSEVTDLNRWLEPLCELAQRTLGIRYGVTLRRDDGLPACAVDRSQLESAVLNLILNARDAMPQGGGIAIETARIQVPPSARGALGDLEPGCYAAVTVRDTGPGMPGDVADRAFEPFFTTKASGSGSGLGLSMVLSFARRSGGTALLETEAGKGTAVQILLPLSPGGSRPRD